MSDHKGDFCCKACGVAWVDHLGPQWICHDLQRARKANEGLREILKTLAWQDYHGCLTGDCPHDSVHDCMEAIRESLAEDASSVRRLLQMMEEPTE